MISLFKLRFRLRIEICNIYKESESLMHLIRKLELDK